MSGLEDIRADVMSGIDRLVNTVTQAPQAAVAGMSGVAAQLGASARALVGMRSALNESGTTFTRSVSGEECGPTSGSEGNNERVATILESVGSIFNSLAGLVSSSVDSPMVNQYLRESTRLDDQWDHQQRDEMYVSMQAAQAAQMQQDREIQQREADENRRLQDIQQRHEDEAASLERQANEKEKLDAQEAQKLREQAAIIRKQFAERQQRLLEGQNLRREAITAERSNNLTERARATGLQQQADALIAQSLE